MQGLPISFSQCRHRLAGGRVLTLFTGRLAVAGPVLPAQFEQWVCAADMQRAGRFRDPVVAGRYLASHVLLNRALAEVLGPGFSPEQVLRDAMGKPYLPGRPVHFSLSRSDNYTVAAVSRGHPVGVDIETRMDLSIAREVAGRVLGREESEAWRRLGDTAALEAFRAIWCLKEAILKVSGEGLSRDPGEIQLARDAAGWRLLRLPEGYGDCFEWELGRADPERGFPGVFYAVKNRPEG